MGAYNWLRFSDVCPDCGERTAIVAQLKYASSYSGDDKGRYHDRSYKVGDKLAWFDLQDSRYKDPNHSGVVDQDDPGRILECTYADCDSCRAKLFAIVAISEFRVVEVIRIGLEKDEPRGFP
jgi:hypothetical protein